MGMRGGPAKLGQARYRIQRCPYHDGFRWKHKRGHLNYVQGYTLQVATTASLHGEELKEIFFSPKKSSLSA